jgi:outer membrane protein assembly factor BamB
MFRFSYVLFALAALGCAPILAQVATTPLFWPDKNGPTLDGVVPESEAMKLPLNWNSETGQNIVWKTDLEDEGHSTPVIGGDRVWFTSASTDGRKQYVYGIDRKSGKVVHHILLFENANPEILGNPLNNYAAPSPVLEADALYVHFGTYGTARLDPQTGKTVWQRRDIQVNHYRGPGSSPTMHGDLIILTFDGINDQFVTALNKKTGETVWKTGRTTDYGDLDPEGKPTRDGDMRKAYHTPTVFRLGGIETLVSVGSRAAFGYEVGTGKELWTVRHGGFNAAIRPLVHQEVLILNTGSERAHTLGIRIDDKMKGDITESHTLWDREKRNASESCPVLAGGLLFQITRGGIITCMNPETGADVWEDRLSGQHLPSPIVAGDRLYFCNDRGDVNVVKAADKFELLATNKLPDAMTASPAVADGAIFIRTKKHLFKIAPK